MRGISSFERSVMESAADAPMLAQTEKWAAVNSGSRNLPGLAAMAAMLADAFAGLPGAMSLVDPEPVEWIHR